MLCSVDHFLGRQDHRGRRGRTVLQERHHHAKPGESRSEIRCPIQRIGDPGVFGTSVDEAAFFREHIVVGKALFNVVANMLVRSEVRLGDDAAGGFLDPDVVWLIEVSEEDLGGGLGAFEDVLEHRWEMGDRI